MNDDELASAWSDVCDRIKQYEDVDPTQIDAFFSRLVPQAMSEGFLMLTANNDFIKSWVERHYQAPIRRALEEIYGVPFIVAIEVDAQGGDKEVAPSAPQQNQPLMATAEELPKPEMAVQREIDGSPDHDNPATAIFRFENFVIGDSNRMAYTMALSVAEEPGNPRLNPLFIYGRSGLGKTHLLRAIQNYINENMPELSVIYVDSADLFSDYVDAGAKHEKDKESYRHFKERYEAADVLLIDDVQYLGGKPTVVDILFQIFNWLTSQGKQIVLSADRAPKNIDIDERYTSRFNSGGTCDIQPPEVETKLGIIRNYIEEYREAEGVGSLTVPENIQLYIAENSSSNIRELRSAVTIVLYQMRFFNRNNISLEEVQELLKNHFSGGPSKKVTVADIQKVVENFYKVSHSDLVGKKRHRDISYARQVAIYLCRDLTELPFKDIGKQFNKDHSTIMYSVKNIEMKMAENRDTREEIELLRRMIREL